MTSGNNEILAESAVLTFDNHQKRAYTVDEISILLQISRSKAYDLCRQGLFKIIKIGRAVRVSKLSFDEWLDQQ